MGEEHKVYRINEDVVIELYERSVIIRKGFSRLIILAPEEAAAIGRYLIDISDPAKVATGMVGATVEQSENNVPVPEQTMDVEGKRHNRRITNRY